MTTIRMYILYNVELYFNSELREKAREREVANDGEKEMRLQAAKHRSGALEIIFKTINNT